MAIDVILSSQKLLDQRLPSSRENQKELAGSPLENGTARWFIVPPFNQLVTVTQHTQDEKGNVVPITREGFLLHTVRDKVITYEEGTSEGSVQDNVTQHVLGHYAYIKNATDDIINVNITSVPPPPTDACIEMSLNSRRTDHGGRLIESKFIRPGGTLHFLQPARKFTVRAIETKEQQDFGTDQMMGIDTVVPSNDNYVEEAVAECRVADAVFFLKPIVPNGPIDPYVTRLANVRKVESNIVRDSTGQH